MAPFLPETAEDCAALLQNAAGREQPLLITGNGSKRLMAGPLPPSSETLSTTRLTRLLQYEPADLTISVESGMRWSDLQKTLGQHRQRIALDPPFSGDATVGGVLASNSSGPLRRAYGTARDLVIGIRFALTDGRLAESGGMVVKNVAGLDLAKLMIGSFGTLAVITSVNFRVHSMPEHTRTFVMQFPALDDCLSRRDQLLQSPLQPETLDLFSPVASARLGFRGYVLAIRAGGSAKVLDRYTRELCDASTLDGSDETSLWQKIREFTPEFLRRQPSGLIVRISSTLSGMRSLLKATSDAVVARGAAGVSYVFLNSTQPLSALTKAAKENGWHMVVEFAPDEIRSVHNLWPDAEGATVEVMKNIKGMFDPGNILNPGRMYGRF